MIINKKSVVLILLVMLLIGCNHQPSDNYIPNTSFSKSLSDNSKIKYMDVSNDSGSISHGLLDEDGNPETEGIYYLDHDEKLTKYITIKNYLGKSIQCTLLMLNNYQQKEFIVDGEYNLTKEIYINNKTDIQVPIELEDFNQGYNDIIFIIALDTSDFLDEEEREAQINLLPLRFTVFYENDTIPQYSITSGKISNEDCDFNLHPLANDRNMDFIEHEMGINEKFEFYVSAGNDFEQDESYSIILFEDWIQKSIQGSKSIFVNIPSSKSVTFPLQVEYSQKGNHEISAILINDIYTIYDMQSSFIDDSSRLGITVN